MQGCLMTVPTPSQLPQTYYRVKGPYLIVVNPDPPQPLQVEGDVPGFDFYPLQVPQMSVLAKVIVFWAPLIASIKSISKAI